MSEIREILNDLIVDHWAKLLTGLLLFAAGRFWGRQRARRDWRKKEFMNRLMISLNSIITPDGGKPTLAIRTIVEKDMKEVLLNDLAVESLLVAAGRTTSTQPMLPLEKEDRWFLLNAVLNEIAERTSHGVLARDLGCPVKTGRYLIALTNEIAGALKTHKVRAMVVRKDHLVSGAFEKPLQLEAPHHTTRLDTLAALRRAYAQDPEAFMEVEIPIA